MGQDVVQDTGQDHICEPGPVAMSQRLIIHYIWAIPLRRWLAKMSTSASAKLHIASQAHPLYACWAIPLKRRLANPYYTLVGQELLARYLRQCVNHGWPILSAKCDWFMSLSCPMVMLIHGHMCFQSLLKHECDLFWWLIGNSDYVSDVLVGL